MAQGLKRVGIEPQFGEDFSGVFTERRRGPADRAGGQRQPRHDLMHRQAADLVIDHDELQRATGALVARGHPGVAVRGWEKVLADYDPAANVDNIARAALGLHTGDIPFSFGAEA